MKKRLCVFSDGTWNTPETEIQTNIFNLATCMAHSSDGIPQIVFYDPGVGSDGSWIERLKGGAFGDGIDLNIQQLYTFLAMNYQEDDEIMLFGYSRGAYTVRSLAGMIHDAGLVKREKLGFVKEAYDLYRSTKDAESETAQAFRAENSHNVKIKLMACFDTVGALGIPGGLFDSSRYDFHDTRISNCIENAVQLASIDEDRKSFQLTKMEATAPNQVTEIFLPGGHGGVGGGNKGEKDLADNSLIVMVEEIEKRVSLGMNKALLPTTMARSVVYRGQPSASYRFLRFLTGKSVRDIGALDAVHASAFERWKSVKEWKPPALDKFRDALNAFQG